MPFKPIIEAKPMLRLPEPEIKPRVINFFRRIGKLYFRFLLGFHDINFIHPENIIDAYKRFFNKKSRLIVAFRHPYGDEAQLMAYAISRQLSIEARKFGYIFPIKPHAHFIHGYEVPLWGSAFERWLLPRVGSIPVYHVKIDSNSIERIKKIMKDGLFPLAIAPEGQVSYTSRDIPRIEHGTARIALWCAEDLEKEGRVEEIEILPVSIHYTWPESSVKDLNRLIIRTERIFGISSDPSLSNYRRLRNISEKMLGYLEDAYSKFSYPWTANKDNSQNERFKSLLNTAIEHAEDILQMKAEGDFITRVYKVRQAAWDRIFRTDISDNRDLNPLEKSLADRLASEAWLASRHMEFTDIGFYMDFEKLKPDDSLDYLIETAQNYYDLAERCRGGNITNRIILPHRTAYVIAGEPVNVSKYAPVFKINRKKAVGLCTEELETGFKKCIADFNEYIMNKRENGRKNG